MHKIIIGTALSLVLVVGCRNTPTPTSEAAAQAAQITLTVDPDPAVVGDATLNLVVTKDGQPLGGLKVDVRGDMTHAGMKPVLGSATTGADGKAAIPFRWSMGGDWIVTVTVTQADGSQVSQDFNLTVKT